jgi:hypothetical protein
MAEFIAVLIGEKIIAEWEDIYSEYVGLRENKSSSFILDILKAITYLRTKQYIIKKCIEVLAVVYSRELATELKLSGCKGKFDWADKEGYSNDLRAADSYQKKFNSQIKKKEKELDEYQKRYGKDSISRKDFDIWAITLGKYLGFRIDYNVMTVSEWCAAMNQYERYCEIMNAENENLLNKKKNG